MLPTARLSQMRAFFAHTSLQVDFTSCPGCFQIIMQEKHSYAHGNPPRTSHIAICEQQAKANPHNRSTNPKAKRKVPIRHPSYFLRRLHKIFRKKSLSFPQIFYAASHAYFTDVAFCNQFAKDGFNGCWTYIRQHVAYIRL